MHEPAASIKALYGSDGLVERILAALEADGQDIERPTVEMFQLVDQLHGGGLAQTEILSELAGIAGGTRVLDAGCGIGGSSRYLAHRHGCTVAAIDITPEYVAAAERLDALCGLEELDLHPTGQRNRPSLTPTAVSIWSGARTSR